MPIGSHASEVAFFLAMASVAWSAAFAWARWLVRPRDTVLGAPEYQEYLAARIARLEDAVSTMSTQLAQLAESQRLAAHVLSERLPAPEPARGAEPRRAITPH